MDELQKLLSTLTIDNTWRSKLHSDLHNLSRHYAFSMYDSICFEPYENMNEYDKKRIVEFLTKNNNARLVLSEKIKEMYPDLFQDVNDIDSIMDYYINLILIS